MATDTSHGMKHQARSPAKRQITRPCSCSPLNLANPLKPPPGVVMWEMLQGCRPFAGLNQTQIIHAVCNGKTLSLPSNTPEALRPLLARCLDPRPDIRCARCLKIRLNQQKFPSLWLEHFGCHHPLHATCPDQAAPVRPCF